MTLVETDAGRLELAVGGGRAGAPVLRFTEWQREDEYVCRFAVEAAASGMTARLDSVGVWDDVAGFFDGLARDFRGWDGERELRVGNELRATAVFGSGGHVSVRWTLNPDHFQADWECTVVTEFEAGEGMTALAADVRAFLEQG